jgi:hypothetical protein
LFVIHEPSVDKHIHALDIHGSVAEPGLCHFEP